MRYTDNRTLLVADGGSTKAAWMLVKRGSEPVRTTTTGINPSVLPAERISRILAEELLPEITPHLADCKNLDVRFFGSGCTPAAAPPLADALEAQLHTAAGNLSVSVDSDIAGAVMAAPATGRCIAGIIGTGSNTCVAEDGEITARISPGGYILGDEGSASWIGKRIAISYLRGLFSRDLASRFESLYNLDAAELIRRIYRPEATEQAPNRFLGQLAPFATQYAPESPLLANILETAAGAFFENYIDLYISRGEATVSTTMWLVGSVAEALSPYLNRQASLRGMPDPVAIGDPLPSIVSRLIQ